MLIEQWLDVRGRKPNPLLLPISKSKRILPRRFTSQAVLYLLQKRATLACVEPFSPHDCRRTFISELLDAGVDLITVQKLAGHESPLTTAKYDRRGEAAKRNAAAAVDWGF